MTLTNSIVINKEYLFEKAIYCYNDELIQLWNNLISNSIHAMDGSGTISIRTARENDNVKISISDSGKGIPSEISERIFEPFFTTKPRGEGTGLGLDIVKCIVEKHNGSISYESKVGVGTTFHVLLPLTE